MKCTLLFLSALYSISVLFAADTITVSFIGPDSMHLKYHADAYPNPVWLVQTAPSFELIQEVTGSGIYHVNEPLAADYRYALATSGVMWVYLDETPRINYDGGDISGYMLFDEEIDTTESVYISGSVVVPEGITLSIIECPFRNDFWVDRDFIVSGTVYVTENVTYTDNSAMVYDIYGLQDLSGPHYGNFYFHPESAGSSLNSAGYVSLYAYAPMSLSVVTQSVLNCGDEAVITASECLLHGVIVTGCNSSVTLDNSIVTGLCLGTTNATVTCNNSRFTYYNPSILLRHNASLSATDCSINKLDINAPCGTCTMTGTTNGVVTINGLLNGSFDHCHFNDNVIIRTVESTPFTCDNSLFFGEVSVISTAVQFAECDFGYPVYVPSPCAANFQRCQFLHQLGIAVNGEGHDLPTVENNSFLYKNAITIAGDSQYTNETVTIGPNYYSDPAGYVYGIDMSYNDMFAKRGGLIGGWWLSKLNIAPHLKKGIEREIHNDMPLRVWEICRRYGQGSITHGYVYESDLTMIKGRETLYCVDVGVNRSESEPIKIRAKYDNQIIYPTRGETIKLHRDYSHLSHIRQEAGYNTVNFILPGVTQDIIGVTVEYQLPGTTNYSYLVVP